MQTAQPGPAQRIVRGAGHGPGLLLAAALAPRPCCRRWSAAAGQEHPGAGQSGPCYRWVVCCRGWPAARLPVRLSCRRSARGRSPFRGSLVVVAWSFPPPGPGLVALLPGGSAGGVSSLVHALAFSLPGWFVRSLGLAFVRVSWPAAPPGPLLRGCVVVLRLWCRWVGAGAQARKGGLCREPTEQAAL